MSHAIARAQSVQTNAAPRAVATRGGRARRCVRAAAREDRETVRAERATSREGEIVDVDARATRVETGRDANAREEIFSRARGDAREDWTAMETSCARRLIAPR